MSSAIWMMLFILFACLHETNYHLQSFSRGNRGYSTESKKRKLLLDYNTWLFPVQYFNVWMKQEKLQNPFVNEPTENIISTECSTTVDPTKHAL